MGAGADMPIWRFSAALAGLLGLVLVTVCPQASPAMSWEASTAATEAPSCARETPSEADACCRRSCEDEGEKPASGCSICRSAVNPSTKARDLVDASPSPSAVVTLPRGSAPSSARLAAARDARPAHPIPAFLLFGVLRN